MSMQPPPNATTAVSLIEKLFGVKTSKTGTVYFLTSFTFCEREFII